MFSQARAAVGTPGCCAIHPSQGDTEFFAMYCDDSVLRSLTNKATMCECLGVRSRGETVVGANSGATGAHPRTCRGALWVFPVLQNTASGVHPSTNRRANSHLPCAACRGIPAGDGPDHCPRVHPRSETSNQASMSRRAPRSRWSTFPCPLSSRSRSWKLSR